MTETWTPVGTLATPFDPRSPGLDIASLLPPLSAIPEQFFQPDGTWQQIARHIDQKGYQDLRFRLLDHRPDINVHQAVWHVASVMQSWEVQPYAYKIAAAAYLMSLWFAGAMVDPVTPSVSHDEDIPIFLRRPETKIAPVKPSRPSPTQAVIDRPPPSMYPRWANFSDEELSAIAGGINTSPLIYKSKLLPGIYNDIVEEIRMRSVVGR